MVDRCIFSVEEREIQSGKVIERFCCALSDVRCSGSDDKQRCPLWAIADSLNRFARAIGKGWEG